MNLLLSEKGFGPLYLETSRSKRLQTWTKLRNWHDAQPLSKGQYPYLNIEPWYEEPDPAWPRLCFTIPMREIFYNAELHYDVLLFAIKKREPAIYQRVDPAEREGKPEPPKNPELEEASKKWESMHPGLREELRDAVVPGLEGADADADGIKFLVFRTADVGRGVLGSLLGTTAQGEVGLKTLDAPAAFSYLFADAHGFAIRDDQTATMSEDLEDLPPSQLIGKSTEEIFRIFEGTIERLKDIRSLYATRTFVILDNDTESENAKLTALVVVATYSSWCARRVSFGALKRGLLKAFEMLFLDPDMLQSDEAGVITEDDYGPIAE